jgi:hypothetical protein
MTILGFVIIAVTAATVEVLLFIAIKPAREIREFIKNRLA